MRKLTALFFTIGLAFTSFGIYRGEVAVVISKGINLCLECVGIG